MRVARDQGCDVPADCILDADGKPTTKTEDFYAGGTLVPLGGRVAGHKGYGLAMASALLGALATIDDPEPTLIGARVREAVDDPRGRVAGVFLVVIDPAAFGGGHYLSINGRGNDGRGEEGAAGRGQLRGACCG